MKDRSIKPISLVDITSYWHETGRGTETSTETSTETRLANAFYAIPYDIPSGTAAAYFPEANVLVPVNSTALESNTPTSKSIEISIASSPPSS